MLHRSLTLETREIGLLQTSTQVRISQQRIPQATLAESAKKNMVIALRKITKSKNDWLHYENLQRVLTLNCASLPVPAPAGLEAGVELLIINLLVGHCLGSDQLKSLCSNYYIRSLLFCGNIRFNLSFRLTYALHIRLSQIHTKNFFCQLLQYRFIPW